MLCLTKEKSKRKTSFLLPINVYSDQLYPIPVHTDWLLLTLIHSLLFVLTHFDPLWPTYLPIMTQLILSTRINIHQLWSTFTHYGKLWPSLIHYDQHGIWLTNAEPSLLWSVRKLTTPSITLKNKSIYYVS